MDFLAALGFLTILPVGRRAREHKSLARAAAFFPLVGLVLGIILAGADYLLRLAFPVLPASALLLVLLVLLSGALHFEGFVDACDGLFGGHSRERRLEIMRQKQVGAYAIAGGVLLLVVKWAAIASLAGAGRPWALALFPALSRWSMALALGSFPYARQQGLGKAFRGAAMARLGIAAAVALLAAGVLGGGPGLLLFAASTALAWLLGMSISRMLGGLTGDTYGAINEVAEAALLVVAVAMSPGLAVLPLWQRWL